MLNFNVDPYYDDFDPNNHYHRILFRPGRAVQARELTQSQTILQDQISKFADHIFKQNTPVKGGQVTVNNKARFLKLSPTYNDNDITASDFLNQIITDATGIVFAKVIATEEAVSGDFPTLVVTYFSGREFAAGDLIYSTNTTTTAQIISSSDYTGSSSVASISEGVFYIVNGYSFSDVQNNDGTYSRYSIGNFVSVQPQTIIVQKYGNTPTKRVGLSISEYISDYVTDPALLDPAVGATNYQAPGADRYTITLTLDTKNIALGSDSGFIELVRVTNGNIQRLVDGTVYGVIDDYFAKRTYDTNGDFVVNDFKIVPKANTATTDTYQLQIGTGVAYIRGYRVENALDKTLETTRARTTETINNNITTVDYGSYIYINNVNSVFDTTNVTAVDFHCINANSSIVSTNTVTYNATRVASGYLRAVSFDTNTTDANTQTYVYKAYLSDMQNYVLSGTAASGTTSNVVFTDTTGKFSSAANAYYGSTITIDAGSSAGDIRLIVSYNGTTKTATVDQPFTTPITSSSTFSLRFGTKDIDLMVVPAGTSVSASAGIDPKGKTGSSSIGETTLYNATSPELVFELGYPYVGNLSDTSYSTFKAFRGISFASGVGSINLTGLDATFFGTASATQSADSAKNYWQVVVTDVGSSAFTIGQIVNFASTNTIALDATRKIATLTAGASTFTGTILAKIAISNAGTTTLALKRKNLYTANTTNVNLTGTNVSGVRVDLTQGQVYIPYANIVTPGTKQSLYVSDVKQIVKIIDTGTPVTVPTNAMLSNSAYDVTGNFIFDNGQTDTYYGPSSITLKNGAPQPAGQLLVLLDYYEHGGGDGYFSVNSYLGAGDGGISTKPETYSQIPYYASKNGTTYNLRDSIDFRLSTLNAQAAFQFRYSTTPTVNNNAGAYLPIDLSSFTTDYTHYLGRKDILVLSKDSSFQLITGKASNSPVYPNTPEGALLMANIKLDPYTSYLPGETTRVFPNMSLEKVQHRRFTMADISDLQTRINNLQYYTSLSLLEKQAADLQVPDNNGLNRFKNGILVDNFSSFAAADSGNLDFFAKINKRDTTLSATETVFNFPLQSKDILASLGNLSSARQTALNFKYHSNSGGASSLITLPYTSANMVVQKIASNTVSLNPFAVSSDEGILDINPPMDMWVSTSKDPDILITDPNMTIYQQGTTLNQLSATDWQTISGTSFTEKTQSDRTVTVATYASQSQQTLSGYYDKVNSLNGTYITDISVQPYIRAQKLIIRAKGMKVNTQVSAFFDGTNVNQYIVQPNIIELDAVSGTFNEGDIVGYYVGSTFTPTARVVSVTKLSSTSVRLYVASDANSAIYATSSTMQNGQFNETGSYVGTTANGTYSSASTKQVSLSGKIAASSGGSSSTLDSGVSYRSGATSITLGPTASATNDFYLGASVKVTTFNQTKIVTPTVVGQQWNGTWDGSDNADAFGGWFSDVIEGQVSYRNIEETYTATITAYNGSTKVATLGTTVNVSSGQSSSLGDLTSTYTLAGTSYLVAQATTSAKVPVLSTDEHGNFSAIFSVPSNTFRTGDRVLRVDNRSAANDPDSATTFAQGVFTASSLATRSQSLNFGATIQAAAKSTVFTQQSQKDKVLINTYSYTLDPVAQSFIIDGATYPNGAFIRSIKVYFRSKPTGTSSVPVKMFVTDTTNGYPTGVALDNTVVVKTAQEVVVSDNPQYLDATTYTEFVFPAPVYIRPNNLYAFVLQTTTPDYTIWVGAQNAIAIPSSVKNLPTDATPTTITKIGGSPYVGALFESQNGITWTADQTKNMMFIIDNCVFDVAASPAVQFVVPKKLPLRKDTVSDIDFYKNANTVPNVSGVYYGKDMRMDAVNMSTTDFTPTSTNISYSYTPTLQSSYSVDSTRNVIPGKYGTTMSENIYFDDGAGARVLDSNSATSFTMTGTMTTTDQYVSPVLSDDGTSLYALRFNINDMGLANNNITVTSGNTVGVTANYSSTPPAVTISAPTAIGGTQAFATANLVYNPATTGYYVDKINITSGGSGYIQTPTITIASNGTISATATVSGETSSKGGNGLVRYITKKVVLTPATDSSDLRVFYTAYKPVGSRVNVYYKVLSRNDTSNFNDQNWVLMTEIGEKPNSFSLSRSDVREYLAAPGSNNQPDNQITYTSSSGTTFTSFSQFAIKIVMSTSDTTKAPVVNDLRVLALPSGSGY